MWNIRFISIIFVTFLILDIFASALSTDDDKIDDDVEDVTITSRSAPVRFRPFTNFTSSYNPNPNYIGSNNNNIFVNRRTTTTTTDRINTGLSCTRPGAFVPAPDGCNRCYCDQYGQLTARCSRAYCPPGFPSEPIRNRHASN